MQNIGLRIFWELPEIFGGTKHGWFLTIYYFKGVNIKSYEIIYPSPTNISDTFRVQYTHLNTFKLIISANNG